MSQTPQLPQISTPRASTPRSNAGSTTPRVATPRVSTPRASTPRDTFGNSAPRALTPRAPTPRDAAGLIPSPPRQTWTPRSTQSSHRADLLDQYHMRQDMDPWAQQVKQDAAAYQRDMQEQKEKQRKKQQAFQEALRQQVEMQTSQHANDSSIQRSERERELAMFRTFQELNELEKREKREKFVKEISDREEQMKLNSARREADLKKEAEDEIERRLRYERERKDAIDQELRHKEKQREYCREMWKINLDVKERKERIQREEREEDVRMMEAYIQMTDSERQKRQAFIQSRRRPTNVNLPVTNAERLKEEKNARLVESMQRQQEAEIKRMEARYAQDKEKKLQSQMDNAKWLREQMDSRSEQRRQQRQHDLEERRRLDEDTAEYYRKQKETKQQRQQKSAMYSQDLGAQMEEQRMRSFRDTIAPQVKV